MEKLKNKDGDVMCPTCGKGMKFLKEKKSKPGKDDGYSEWRCDNKNCKDYSETEDGVKIHRLYDDGDCEEL